MTSRKEQETWVNASPGRVQVRKYNAKGLLGAELIGPGKNVYLTPEEREINQEAAASPELDVFANGLLQPVRLLDDADELTVVSPNHISETEMRELFSAHWKTFDAKVGEITNPSTLERLLAMADEVDAKVRQVDTIKARIEELNPAVVEVAGAAPADAGLRSGIRAVTPG